MRLPPTPSLQQLRDFAADLIMEDFAWKALSLGFAVALWAWVQSELVVDKRMRAEVQYRWPVELVRVDEVPTSVLVTVQGPQGDVRRLDRRSLSLSVDLSEADEGDVTVDFTTLSVLGLPEGVKLLHISPPSVDIQLDQRMTREVRVSPAVTGEPAEGWVVVDTRVEPERVEITGPQTIVRTLDEVYTDIVDINGSRSNRRVDVPIALPQQTVRSLSSDPIQVYVDLEPVVTSRHFPEAPLVLPSGAWDGWTTEPRSAHVVLRGPLAEVSAVPVEDVIVSVHVPEEPGSDPPEVAAMDPEAPAWLEVVHGGPDTVFVEDIAPSTARLVPPADPQEAP